MFDWLWHLRGSIALERDSDVELILANISALLRRQRKRPTAQNKSSIAFESPLWKDFSSPNWLALAAYDRGEFWIERRADSLCLRYDLTSLHGLIFCLVASVVFGIAGAMVEGFLRGMGFMAAAFGWLYGMNILSALVRVPWLIRRTAYRT